MAHEMLTNQHGSLSYVCCTKLNQSDSLKQFHAFHRPAGHGQLFSSIEHDIRFPLTAFNEDAYGCTISHRLYPLVIICRALNTEMIKYAPPSLPLFSSISNEFVSRSPSTICGTTANCHTTATTTALPTFDQYHIILASIKLLRLNNNTSDHPSIVLLSQKHVYHGMVFKLFELYGIENHPSKFSSTNPINERRKVSPRKKPVMKVVSTSTISENEPFMPHR